MSSDQETCPCPCGGGQSCIVDRRKAGDFVHEDYLMEKAGVQKRKNCFEEPSAKHRRVFKEFNKQKSKEGFESIVTRWTEEPI